MTRRAIRAPKETGYTGKSNCAFSVYPSYIKRVIVVEYGIDLPQEGNRTMKEKIIGEPLTYTVLEAAHLLGMSKNQTYLSIADGDIPSKRVGGKILIPRARLHAWLNEGAITA